MTNGSDREEPAMNIVETSTGSIDINNISGKRRAELIARGIVPALTFVTPPNIAGKNIGDRVREVEVKKAKSSVKNKLTVGDLVEFKGQVREVVAVSNLRGVKLAKREGGKTGWIHHTKVTVKGKYSDEE